MKFLGLLSVGFVCMSSLEAMSLSQQEKKANDAQLRSADVMRRSTSGSSGEDEQGSGQDRKEKENLEELTEEELNKLEKIFSDENCPLKSISEEDEKEMVKQVMQGIVEGFYSDLLGFSRGKSSSPIEQLEEWCGICNIDELAQLDELKSLKDILKKQVNNLYPNVQMLLQKLK